MLTSRRKRLSARFANCLADPWLRGFLRADKEFTKCRRGFDNSSGFADYDPCASGIEESFPRRPTHWAAIRPPNSIRRRLPFMYRAFRPKLFLSTLLGITLLAVSGTSLAQYKKTNLVSNLATGAKHQDTQLQNAWGLAYAPGNPFWISDEYSGLSTLYDGTGVKQGLVVTIPTATGSG